MVNSRSIARLGTLAVGLGIGAAWAHTPVAQADTSNDLLSSIDSLLSGVPAADPAAVTDFQISFNGTDLFPTLGNEATATTTAGTFGLAIASGDGASATAEGGFGDYALASGTNALANAGSLTAATGNNFDSAVDIGNNAPTGVGEIHDGAYAGAGSLDGGVDSGTSSNDSAYDFGNNGPDSALDNGTNGAFAGDSALGREGATAGNGDTAYTAGNLNGFEDGSGAFGGNNDFASSTGTETGTQEGAFATFGNNNTAIADTNYTVNGDGVGATYGNGNFAYVDGPDNSVADAGGTGAANLGSNDIAYVSDPFSSATSTADSAISGSDTMSGPAFSNDLAEVLFAHGNATADSANLMYDIISLFGHFTGAL